MPDPVTTGAGALAVLAGLTKPATTLIEKISDAVGGIAKPYQMVRVATAEAKIELIKAQSKIEISEVERRALERVVREEGKKQENIESITAQAIPLLTAEAKPENVEDDWITHFFDKARLVSDAEMQRIWAQILGAEANKPNSISKKTVDLVSTLDKSDAQAFCNLCSFIWMIGQPLPLVFEPNSYHTEAGISFIDLTHLDSIGLIRLDSITGFSILNLPKVITVLYYGQPITIQLPNEDNTLEIGRVLLTKAGKDLARICEGRRSEAHFMSVLEGWLQKGYILWSPLIIK